MRMASPLPPSAGMMGEMNSSGGRSAMPLAMNDFQIGQAPALHAHVARHDAESFGLDLAGGLAEQRMIGSYNRARPAIEEGWKNQPVTMEIGAHQQHGAADGVE